MPGDPLPILRSGAVEIVPEGGLEAAQLVRQANTTLTLPSGSGLLGTVALGGARRERGHLVGLRRIARGRNLDDAHLVPLPDVGVGLKRVEQRVPDREHHPAAERVLELVRLVHEREAGVDDVVAGELLMLEVHAGAVPAPTAIVGMPPWLTVSATSCSRSAFA